MLPTSISQLATIAQNEIDVSRDQDRGTVPVIRSERMDKSKKRYSYICQGRRGRNRVLTRGWCMKADAWETMECIRVLNIDILSIKNRNLLEKLEQGVLFTPNVDHIVRLQKDKAFYEAYQKADWVVCDSVILHRLSQLLKQSILESIPGSTFFHDFCDYHRQDENCRIFILGTGGRVPVSRIIGVSNNQ